MVAWCEQERLLASLYGLHHRAASDLQGRTDVDGFCCILERFVRQCVEPFISNVGARDASSNDDADESDGLQPSGNGYSPGQWCCQSDMRAVCHAVRAMDFCTSPSAITWFPDYGCALVALGTQESAPLRDGTVPEAPQPDSEAAPEDAEQGVPPGTAAAAAGAAVAAAAAADTLSLHLVGLDEWCFTVHSSHAYGQAAAAGSNPARPFQHTACCGGHTILPCGDVDTSQMGGLLDLVRSLEAERREAHRKQKYGGGTEPGDKGQKGFERTPAFMHSVIRDALEGLWSGMEDAMGQELEGDEEGKGDAEGGVVAVPRTLPRGGFCDVGRHTGGDAGRDTAWPLVREVLQVLLRHSSAIHPRPRDPDQHAPQLLFRLTMAHLHAWLLHRQTQLLQPATLAPHVVDALMRMLREACGHAASLAADGVDVSPLEATCCACRQRLEEIAGQRALDAAAAHRLPAIIDPWVGLEGPTGVVPVAASPSGQGEGLAATRRRADKNLGAVPLLREGCGFVRLLEAMQGQRQWADPRDDVAAMVVLRSVERELYGRVARWAPEPPQAAGFGGGYGSSNLGASGLSSSSGSGGALSSAEVEALEQVVDCYRITVQAFLDTPAADAVMRVELLSREVLVVWAAYCLIHEAAGREHPLVLRYGVLDERPWEGLRHLVLCDRAAVDAALGVCAYLQQRSVPGRQLFSLRDGGAATNAFALEVARGSRRLCGIWEAEKEDAAARKAAHWREVQRKQQLAAQLRVKLSNLRSTANWLAEETNRHYRHFCDALNGTSVSSKYYSRYQAVQGQLSANQQEQSRVSAELTRAEKAPPPVLQPLPKNSDKALTWLFYLHMPPLLRHLSRASFLAQQCLLPLPCSKEVAQSLLVQPPDSHLTPYYNRQRTNPTYLSHPRQAQGGHEGAVQIWSCGKIPNEQHVGSGHVDNLYGPDDGVWHPDQLVPHMGWEGSGCEVEEGQGLPDGLFSPWGLDAKYDRMVVHRFTEQLPGEGGHVYEEAEEGTGGDGGGEGEGGGGVSGLQWALPMYGGAQETAATRGNLAIARQDLRPPWMSKPAFLAFGALRSYPLRQLHRLCAALHARALALAQPAVQTLVRQLLYHTGPVTGSCPTRTQAATSKAASGSSGQRAPGAGAGPFLVWREDWDAKGDVLPTLCAELSALADELEHAPRDQEAALLLGEVAAYLSDWHVPCRTVARRFAAMTSRAADEMEARVLAAAAAGEGELVAQLRAKQVRWRAMALGCYGAGRLDGEDVGQMLQLLVLIHHGCVFQDDRGVQEQLRRVQVAAHAVVVRRAGEVAAAAGRRPELLTAAVRRVLQRTPEELAWKQLPAPDSLQHGMRQQQQLLSGGYEAVGSDGNLYSVNVLDGAVLINGRPPSRLPKEVTEHPLFVRVFGQGTNFEVGRSGDGVLQTLSPVRGRFYDFFLADCNPDVGRGGQQHNRYEQPEEQEKSDEEEVEGEEEQQQLQRLVVTEIERQPPGGEGGAGGSGGIAGVGAGNATAELRLELLDPLEGGEAGEAACGAWGGRLPVRLRQLHSHWISRERGVILLRPRNLQQRDTRFILSYNPPKATCRTRHVSYDCRRVPPHLRAVHWCELLRHPRRAQLTDRLLLAVADGAGKDQEGAGGNVSHVVNAVLGKMEEPCFIHTYELLQGQEAHGPRDAPTGADAEGTGGAGSKRKLGKDGSGSGKVSKARKRSSEDAGRMQREEADVGGGDGGATGQQGDAAERVLVFELPRYGLEFELRGWQLLSRDYSGYRLRREQQLVAVVDGRQQHGAAAGAAGVRAGVRAGAAEEQEADDNARAGHSRSCSGAATPTASHLPPAVHHVSYTLPEFRQYLVLERVPGGPLEMGARRADELVLVPSGVVWKQADGCSGSPSGSSRGTSAGDAVGGWANRDNGANAPGGLVRIFASSYSGAQQRAHCYEVHGRFGHLVAPSVPARLQLAALYAATSTLLPEPHTHRATGAQTALQLLRQCWGNRPLTIWELCQLQRVGQLGGHLAPALHLLAHELQLSVWQLHELGVAFAAAGASGAGGHASPASGSGPKGGLARPRLNADAAAAYLLEAGSNGRAAAASAASVCAWWQQPQPANPRQLLAPGERARVLGMGQDGPSAVAIGTWGQRRGGCVAPLLDIAEPLPVPLDVVSTTEEQLAALVVTVPVQGGSSGSGAGGSSTTAASGGALPPVAVPYPLQDDTAVPEALRGKAAFAAGPAAPLTPPAASPRSAPKARKASAAARGSTQAQPCGTASAARSGQRADGAAGLAAGAGAAAASGMPLPLAAAMHAELRASWEAHQGIVMAGRRQMAAGAKQRILALQATTKQHRETMEAFLHRHTTCVPACMGSEGAVFRLHRLCDRAPCPGPLDWLRCAWQHRQLLQQLNPFLSEAARKVLHQGVLMWLQLCVLEDRLGRLVALAEAGAAYKQQLMQELLVRRTWEAARHPQWLAFEAEGRLQIRPAQYAVARHLLANPGAIVQLNMGEGKTRVILPMLALHWADGSRLVRLHFLSPLLEEAHAHLHQHLCASVMGRKLLRLPFHRDVELTPRGARALLACLKHCQQEGGLLLVAPEHRLSLQLKWHELRARARNPALSEQQRTDAGHVCAVLHAVQHLPYTDLLDESDELLHHRFQLIYAVGASMQLPALGARVAAVQALLHTLQHLVAQHVHVVGAATAASGAELLTHGAAVLQPTPGASPGAWCGLRLLHGEALEGRMAGLRRGLAEALLAAPPHAMRWLRGHPMRDQILTCITDASVSAEAALRMIGGGGGAQSVALAEDQVACVLALRGLLGCSVLPHALQKRHLVDYGVDRRPTARKRLAVPYRAAHTPSERSEFAQPDVALLLTHLSYYYDGLSLYEFRTALDTLLRMGGSAQRAYYDEWMRLAAGQIPRGALHAFDAPAKVDPTNPQQLALMHTHMRHNMGVVDFWLAHCVLPSETQQFPQRLAASAWHLSYNASGGHVAGFSGTNDNHRLLPLLVHQDPLPDPHLAATNGRMLDLILDNPHVDSLAPQPGQPVWQAVLTAAAALRLDALLDCGALLAGASNREAADFVLPLLDRSRFKGVCYHEPHPSLAGWTVLDRHGRRLPRHSSPVSEREAFVLYDDARCRGADLQLRRDAVGLLTLGPGLCKDKLMQAAGRLRMLGRGQTLRFLVPQDVEGKVRQLCGMWQGRDQGATQQQEEEEGEEEGRGGKRQRRQEGQRGQGQRKVREEQLTSRHVLRWVMGNTVAATQAGLLPWASQGLDFAYSCGHPDRAVQDELLQLDDMYGSGKQPRPVGEVVSERSRALRRRADIAVVAAAIRSKAMCTVAPAAAAAGVNAPVAGAAAAGGGDSLGRGMEELMARVERHAAQYGEGHVVTLSTSAAGQLGAGGVDEECERELEEEEEEEEEVERQVPRVQPAKEYDWEYGRAVAATCAKQLGTAVHLESLPNVMKAAVQLTGSEKWTIPWSKKVLCTRNFVKAVDVRTLQRDACAGEYLRPVDAVLVFPAAGEVVLVSEREADQLLAAMRRAAAARGAAGGSSRAQQQQGPALVSLCYAHEAFRSGGSGRGGSSSSSSSRPPALAYSGGGRGGAQWRAGLRLGAAELASAMLFGGECAYGADEGLRRALGALVGGRRGQVEALVGMRGKGALLPRSDLEDACGGPEANGRG